MGKITDIFKGVQLSKDAKNRLAKADKLVATLESERNKLQSEKEKIQLEKETSEFQVKRLQERLKQKEAELEECKNSQNKPPSGGTWMAD